MPIPASSKNSAPLLLRGVQLDLSDAMKQALESKAARILRHERRIVRVRIEVGRRLRGRSHLFTAKGQLEIAGPDLCASVTNVDAYTTINLLMDRLDRMLRKRATAARRHRTADDIRKHPVPVVIS